ncbi:MAG: 6-carboxytetrahydropterin synthase QueD [Planctomycetia bacterium]|nr:6-carboxytetrahydropterin synthase QueD [Planctomycetia bacterium]
MYSISREFSFSYGHRLLNYEGKCKHLHGHNARVRITLSTNTLNEKGMVLDFSSLKTMMGTWIEDHLDHRMILQKEDTLADLLIGSGDPVLLVEENPTAEFLARLICDQGKEFGLNIQKVEFWETEKCCAIYFNE